MSGDTWVLAPTGSAARERFDAIAAEFVSPPLTYPVITRSPTMLWWLLRHEKLLTFLPVNFARPLIEAREVRELDVRPANTLEPLGLLRPIGGLPAAAEVLVQFLHDQARLGEKDKWARKSAALPPKSGVPGSDR